MRIHDAGLGRIEVRTLPLPEFVRGAFATYLHNGQVMVFYKIEGDPKDEGFVRIATMHDDGSAFREIFSGVIEKKKTANGIRHMPFADDRRVLLGDYILECEPDIAACERARVVPIQYPWGIDEDPSVWLHWSEIIIAPDNEHMCWTTLYKRMSCVVAVGRLRREDDRYVIENPQIISSDKSFRPDPQNPGCVLPLPHRGGEVKQFVRGGTAISQVGGADPYAALPGTVVQDLLSEEMIRVTHCPGYEETTIFSPDEKLGLTMSTRASEATNCAILGLMPRPYAAHTLAMIYNDIYMYAVAGPRFFRKGNIGPVLIEIDKSIADPGYRGVPLNDPEEEWVYHSPMSWHIGGKKAMWQEQKRGGSDPRIRIAELLDYVPSAPVAAQPTPDSIPYASAAPDAAPEAPLCGMVMGRHAGSLTFEPKWTLQAGGIAGYSVSTYQGFSEDGKTFYDGYERIEKDERGTRYEADLRMTGEKRGEMRLRLAFTKGGYTTPPRLDRTPDAQGVPASHGYAEADGLRLSVDDMRA